jgi:hypothetical protein
MVGDFVAKDHLACFVLSLVRDDFGLGEITGRVGRCPLPVEKRIGKYQFMLMAASPGGVQVEGEPWLK